MEDLTVNCPICNRNFSKKSVEDHVNKCIFLNTENENNGSKRTGTFLNSPQEKKIKLTNFVDDKIIGVSKLNSKESACSNNTKDTHMKSSSSNVDSASKSVPLADKMRPSCLEDIVGQHEAFGDGSMLRSMLKQQKIPNMILWGPPGCGKTSMANIIATICKQNNNLRFVKLSATMAGINDVKDAVKIAKNELKFNRQTVLFMDEIHRFNKLQQDTFLPHVENGTIVLIGATTENPSFSLNNALLSRCRVVVMSKLTSDDILEILERALRRNARALVVDSFSDLDKNFGDDIPTWIVERGSIRWLAEICDGDARVALGSLELAIDSSKPGDVSVDGPGFLTLEHIKNGIKRSHVLYDRKGDEHYNVVSALHKAIRASDDNAALYWTARALHGGEDPLFVARRLVRAASEDIGLAEPCLVAEAVACLRGCRALGMPECAVLLAQCAVRLARAPKSRQLLHALRRCQRRLQTGPLPPVPLALRNAPTRLMQQLGYGKGYNTNHKDESQLIYMPEGLEEVNFFDSDEDNG